MAESTAAATNRPLAAREDRLIELLGELRIAAEDQATAGATQGLVGGGGDHVTDGNRVGVHTGGHQTSDVGHVGEQVGAHFIGDGAEGLEVDRCLLYTSPSPRDS